MKGNLSTPAIKRLSINTSQEKIPVGHISTCFPPRSSKKKQTKVVQQKDTELQPIHPKELTFFHFLCLRYGIPIGTKNDVQRYGWMDELRHTCTNKYIPYMTMLKNWYRCCWNRGAPLLFVEHFQPVTSSPFPSQDSGEIWWPFWLNHVRYVQPRGVCNTVEGKSQLRSTSSKND